MTATARAEEAVRTSGLTKDFGSVEALADLDLVVGTGEVVGVLGPNGAGKTTLLRLLLGLLVPTRGGATIFGLDCQHDAVDAHRLVAYVPGEASLWPSLTGIESLHLLGRAHGSLDDAYRDELIDRFEIDPSKKVRALSKGNRQKLVLVAALMTRAPLLILDEPTGGLDPLMEQEFRRCIADARLHGQSVLLSSHILSEVEALCDRIGILRAGRLVEIGTLAEMRHLSALSVEVHFKGVVPDVSAVEGVSAVSVQGATLRCQVRGAIQPFLDAISKSSVQELLSREPTLEELFLSHYGGTAPGPADRPDAH